MSIWRLSKQKSLLISRRWRKCGTLLPTWNRSAWSCLICSCLSTSTILCWTNTRCTRKRTRWWITGVLWLGRWTSKTRREIACRDLISSRIFSQTRLKNNLTRCSRWRVRSSKNSKLFWNTQISPPVTNPPCVLVRTSTTSWKTHSMNRSLLTADRPYTSSHQLISAWFKKLRKNLPHIIDFGSLLVSTSHTRICGWMGL